VVVGKEMPEFFKNFKVHFENRMLMNLEGPVHNRLGSYMGLLGFFKILKNILETGCL
jgi:hypothetical protein